MSFFPLFLSLSICKMMMTRDSETTVTLMMTLLHHDLLTLNGHVAVNNQQENTYRLQPRRQGCVQRPRAPRSRAEPFPTTAPQAKALQRPSVDRSGKAVVLSALTVPRLHLNIPHQWPEMVRTTIVDKAQQTNK